MTSSISEPIGLSDLAKGVGENLWVWTANLVKKYQPVNLGQGNADFDEAVPKRLKELLVATQNADAPATNNQYCRSQGHPELVSALADLYSDIMGRKVDAMKEVIVTVGALESLYCIINGVVNAGEEVILIEPFYDGFQAIVRAHGAVPRYVPLLMKPGGTCANDFFTLDEDALTEAFNEKTKAIIVNTPHNPTGKVFSRKEIEFIAKLCKQHNCLYISDEVYEWVHYDSNEVVRVASLPGMWERTLTVGSAGKTFSVTGWKTGWTVGPEYLVSAAQTVHAFTVYTAATPIQLALADMFREERKLMGTPSSYWYWLVETLKVKRERMYKILSAAGFHPIMPNGGYFMMADASEFAVYISAEGELDQRVVEWMIQEKGVAAIPVTAFYSAGSKSKFDKFIRFCFIKGDSTLDAADEKFKLLKVKP